VPAGMVALVLISVADIRFLRFWLGLTGLWSG
jgi:hypothetical protein